MPVATYARHVCRIKARVQEGGADAPGLYQFFYPFFRVLDQCEQGSNYTLSNKISPASSKAFYYLIFLIVFDFSRIYMLCLSVTFKFCMINRLENFISRFWPWQQCWGQHSSLCKEGFPSFSGFRDKKMKHN